MFRAYKTKLRLNNEERATMNRCAGVARFVYNWALRDRMDKYDEGNPTTYYKQKKRFNAIKDVECSWIRSAAPYSVVENAFRNLDIAYQRYFRAKKDGTVAKKIDKLKSSGKWDTWKKRKQRQGYKGYQIDPCFPRFKSRYKARKTFTLRGTVTVEDRLVKVPVLGWLRLTEKCYLPIGRHESQAITISKDGNEWYISIAQEGEPPERPNQYNGTLGIDLGVKTLAICSDGTIFDAPKALRKYEKKLARLDRELGRRQYGSNNWKKTKAKMNKLHAKIRRTRRHAQHNASRCITVEKMPSTIVLEDLNVSGMVKNRHLAKSVSDAGMYELRRQIEYKADWYGIEVVKVNRWFPSSKTCSRCGVIRDELPLSERTFVCDSCGFEIDRDLNAAINLAALGEPVNDGGLPVELAPVGVTVKQEVGVEHDSC